LSKRGTGFAGNAAVVKKKREESQAREKAQARAFGKNVLRGLGGRQQRRKKSSKKHLLRELDKRFLIFEESQPAGAYCQNGNAEENKKAFFKKGKSGPVGKKRERRTSSCGKMK